MRFLILISFSFAVETRDRTDMRLKNCFIIAERIFLFYYIPYRMAIILKFQTFKFEFEFEPPKIDLAPICSKKKGMSLFPLTT